MRTMGSGARGIGASVGCLLASAAMAGGLGPELPSKGRILVVASDGDMQASAYQGDRLGPQTPDLLTVIRLDRPLTDARPVSVPVSNSVVGPPSALTLTPDGRYALVAETRGRNTNGPDAKLAQLPPGRALTVVDLVDPDRPKVVQRLIGRENPLSVSVSPDGGRVAVAYAGGAGGPPLVLYRLRAGRLEDAQSPGVPGFEAGDALKGAAYHPGGALALVYAKPPRLAFVRLREVGGRTELTTWGNDVALGPTPFEVRFAADGRFALVNDMTVPPRGDGRGMVTSIAVAQAVDPRGAPRHVPVSSARTGIMPEGLAVSPDGRWVVTTNLERTADRVDDPHHGGFATLTLLRLNPVTGRLTRVGDRAFNGIIPEGVVFDDTGRRFAVICFDHARGRPRGRSVDFWTIGADPRHLSRVIATPTRTVIRVPRGAQSLVIAR